MIAFILRRSAALVGVLFCVITITFFLVRISPGGPFSRERKIPPAIEKQLLARYNLDGTLWQQYIRVQNRRTSCTAICGFPPNTAIAL